MKILNFRKFLKKKYGERITPEEFKSIKVGTRLLYVGSVYEVEENDGYTLKLDPVDGGKKIGVNLNQFIRGGQIN